MSIKNKAQLIKDVNAALDEIRPHLAVDGGDVEVIDITDDMTVRIKWLGNCEGCNMTIMTMKAGVQETLKRKFPNIQNVVAINGVEA